MTASPPTPRDHDRELGPTYIPPPANLTQARAPARFAHTSGIGVLFVLGIVVAAVGAGLGPAHAAEEGVTLASVSGLVLLAAGAALSVWSSVRLLRRTRRRWWILTIPLLLVITWVGLWTLGQAVVASFPPRPELGVRTPADLDRAYLDVRFPAADGTELAGWYLPSQNGAAVALMHGAGSTRSAVLDQADVLNGHGYGVLLFDARGYGHSAGQGMDFGWYGESDAAGAVDFLTTRPDVDGHRIGLVGLSMGGEEALGAAGADPRVAAVVAEGATNRVSSDRAFLDQYGVRGEVQQGIDWLTYAATGLLTDAPRPPALRHSVATAGGRADPTEFLLITAGAVPDEGFAAEGLQSAAPDAVTVWTVAGAGHTQGLQTAPRAWERRVLAFLDHSLTRR